MGQNEGVIKFQCNWQLGEVLSQEILQDLMIKRDLMYALGLIGVNPEGIDFGNLSKRWGEGNQFIISGTQTSHLSTTTPANYTRVSNFDLNENRLTCCGPVKASSESLTHGAIYQTCPEIKGIIHIHNHHLWKELLYQVPTTHSTISYGTPEMAQEMIRILHEMDIEQEKIIVMAGHPDGIICFGQDLQEPAEILHQLAWDYHITSLIRCDTSLKFFLGNRQNR